MARERESNYRNLLRTNWVAMAVCPHCDEANTASRSMLIELNEDGTAHCNNCSHTWKPDV